MQTYSAAKFSLEKKTFKNGLHAKICISSTPMNLFKRFMRSSSHMNHMEILSKSIGELEIQI